MAAGEARRRPVPRLVADEEPGLVVLLEGSAVCLGRGQQADPRFSGRFFVDLRFSRRHLLLSSRPGDRGLWRVSAGRTARAVFLVSCLDGSRRRVPVEGGDTPLFDGDVLVVELEPSPAKALLRYSLRVLDTGVQRRAEATPTTCSRRPGPPPPEPTDGLEAAQNAYRIHVLAELDLAMQRVRSAATHDQVLEAAASAVRGLGQARDSYTSGKEADAHDTRAHANEDEAEVLSQESCWGGLPQTLLREVLALLPSAGGLDSARGVCRAWGQALPCTALRLGQPTMGLRYAVLPGRRVKSVVCDYRCKQLVAKVRTRPLWRDELTGQPVDITVVSRGPKVLELYTRYYDPFPCQYHKDTIKNDPHRAAEMREHIRDRVVSALKLGDHPHGTTIQEVIPTHKRLLIVAHYPECATATIHDHFLLDYAQEQGGLSEDAARRLVPQLLAFARSVSAHQTCARSRRGGSVVELRNFCMGMHEMLTRSKVLVAEGADGPDPAGAVLKIGLLDDIPMLPREHSHCSIRPGEAFIHHRTPLMDMLYDQQMNLLGALCPPELEELVRSVRLYIHTETLDPDPVEAPAMDLEKLLVWTCGAMLVAIVSVSPRVVGDAAGIVCDWGYIDDEGPVAQLSPGLADLTRKMMEREPGRRIGLQDVAAHPWCAGQAAAGAPQQALEEHGDDKSGTGRQRCTSYHARPCLHTAEEVVAAFDV